MLISPDHAHVDEDDFFYQEGGNDEVKDKYGADVAELKVENSGINRERGCTDVLCLLFSGHLLGPWATQQSMVTKMAMSIG